VLFSNNEVAQFINENFEPVWQSVRPVPIVSIDFGNGRVITKTLRGNIATYVCDAQGKTLDILPGIYTARDYVKSLNGTLRLASAVAASTPEQQDSLLCSYHKRKVDALARSAKNSLAAESDRAEVGPDLAQSQLLGEDTAFNQTVRRLQIHQHLASAAAATPAELTRWLYKDVLHSDLDDPYLGLKDTLFGSDPFSEKVSLK